MTGWRKAYMGGRESQLLLAPGSMLVAAVSQLLLHPLLHAAQLCVLALSQCLMQVSAYSVTGCLKTRA